MHVFMHIDGIIRCAEWQNTQSSDGESVPENIFAKKVFGHMLKRSHKGFYSMKHTWEGVVEIRPMVLGCVALLMCSLFSGLVLGRDDPIEVLCLVPFPGIYYYPQILCKEPMLDVTYVPTEQYYGYDYPPYSGREAQRAIREYFPRSYEDLTDNYEFVLLLTWGGTRTVWEYFKDEQVEMLRRGIEEGGLGALRGQDTDLDWSYVNPRSEIWAGLSLSDAFPSDPSALLAEDHWSQAVSGRYVINEDPSLPPVLTPYTNLTMCWYYPYADDTLISGNLMIPRQGSQTYLWKVSDAFSEYAYPEPGWIPSVLGWRYGEGYTWSLADSAFSYFFSSGEIPEGQNAGTSFLYGHDAFFGLVMYGAGRDVPLDVVLVHEIRERFGEYADATAYISSMIDFIAKFDFNINPMLVKSNVLLERWREGRRLYMAQEYDESYEVMNHLTDDVEVFMDVVLAFKDQALLWVYVTEWVAVTGTFLLAGFFLWTLMVSRRFYRKVDQTRLRPPPRETGAEYPQYSRKEDSNPPWHGEREYSQFAIS